MAGHFLDELQSVFATRGGHPALSHHDQVYSYGDLANRARRVAARLQKAGVHAGDRVALCLSDKPAFLTAHLGALFAGAVTLPLNPGLTRDELSYFLKDSGTSVAVVDQALCPLIEDLQAAVPELRGVLPAGCLAEEVAEHFREPTVAADQPCLLIYSSGTTGWPKGVVHTHANVALALRSLRDCWRITRDDRIVNVLPLFHIHGLCFATQATLLAGGCVHIEDHFDPVLTMKAIENATVFMAVPTIYYRFLDQPGFRAAARNWQTVRLFTCGSAPIRADVLPELEAVLGRPVINRYGMSEAFVITSLPLGGPWPGGSVGVPLHGVELRIVREDGAAAAATEVGTVHLRGPNLFREYWRRPDATRAAFADGWFETGDLGQVDDHGFLTLVGRKNDLIITNGFNVYPQVVERVLNACSGVRESAVLGVPDKRRGERVVAVLVRADPALDEKRVDQYVREHLVEYQRPREVHFVDALPRNALGKVLRRELRDVIVKGL